MSQTADQLAREADTLLRQGQSAAAIDSYRRLLDLQPQRADAWYNLGYLLKAAGRYEEALGAYGRALATGIGDVEEVHLNRAVIYSDHLRRDDEAERELRTALELRPGYLPALLNLGNLHEERGRRAEAIDCYRRIQAAPPTGDARERSLRDEALARLAHLAAPTDPDDPVLQKLQEAAASASGEAQANLWFALGRACDRLGLYDQAFDAFTRGNRDVRERSRGYDRARLEAAVDSLIAAFADRSHSAASGDSGTGPAPLFICGMFRSGSTLVEQALSAHPQVTAGGELELLPRLVAGVLTPFPASMSTLTAERAATLADGYRSRLAELFPGAAGDRYVTDKRPDNFLLVGLIKRLFPHAKIVHTVRNPLDNGLSVYMQHLNPAVAAYAADLGDIGHYYGQYRRLMAHWKALYPDDIIDLDYDRFVRAPRATLEPLLGFLDLPWDARCLEFHRLDNTVKTASYWQVRRPLYAEASGRWRGYAKHLRPLQEALQSGGIATPSLDTVPAG